MPRGGAVPGVGAISARNRAFGYYGGLVRRTTPQVRELRQRASPDVRPVTVAHIRRLTAARPFFGAKFGA